MEPVFLSLTEVLEIHQDQLSRYGGDTGIRDVNLLKSALAMPAATFGGQYLHTDLCEMAATYLFHIVKNHPFVDGNKRVGVVSALIFLTFNGIEIDVPEDALADMVLTVAGEGRLKSEVAVFFREYAENSG